ncbi:unnamed protein product [Paramecium octaurelia]|uniref:WD domain, G-beta repeat protein n=1 Tax=Paramecium octaurelia TaxID=43137 RepID=A0A8S1WTM7_PAROT|nr:unnamed protein product [Paramecium octaurelia]CAD8191511.1 unnamed protein product [Paramecium octaurelia]
MKGLEKDLDSSFDKINNLIDSVFIIDSPIYKFSNPRLELAQIKVDQFHLIGQSKFQYNILQEVKSQTSLKIQEQLQFKLQSDSRYSDSFISSQINDLQEVNQIQSPKTSSNLKKFTYQIIEDNSIKEQQICFAITINKNCSKVAVGCEEQIKIYEFKQGMVKQTEVLNEHTSYVYTLNFIEKSNQLISGDVGGSIVIWSNYKNSQLNSLQTIKAHSNYLRCLILNSHEDLFITCSDDQTIKFWNLKSEWVCQQTITDHTGRVYQISLNDQENKLISCDQDNSILVIEYSKQSEKWIVIQKIKVDVYGFRLCFINNDIFTQAIQCMSLR